ncbi:unnamed protein product, partial [Polarella glacialis]
GGEHFTVSGEDNKELASEESFLRASRRLLRGQREVWRQHVALITQHSGRSSGGGSWSHRTEILRNALLRWRELRRSMSAASPDMRGDDDGALLQSPSPGSVVYAGSGTRSPSKGSFAAVSRNASPSSLNRSASRPPYQRRLESNIDLVDPDDAGEMIISLPIEPMVQFRGTVIEESEVIPSKCAPLMLTCRMQPLSLGMVGGSERGLGGGFQGTGPGPVVLGAPETREKYLLKFVKERWQLPKERVIPLITYHEDEGDECILNQKTIVDALTRTSHPRVWFQVYLLREDRNMVRPLKPPQPPRKFQ